MTAYLAFYDRLAKEWPISQNPARVETSFGPVHDDVPMPPAAIQAEIIPGADHGK
jgi:hypothetical protein